MMSLTASATLHWNHGSRPSCHIRTAAHSSNVAIGASGSHLPPLPWHKSSIQQIQQSRTRRARNLCVEASLAVVTEPATSVTFPATLGSGGAELLLAGAGVREKKIAFIGVKVYAVAFYIENEVLSRIRGWSFVAATGKQPEEFFTALADEPLQKAIEIVLVRDVDGAQFWSALDETLAPRMKADGASGKDALAKLGAVFKDAKLTNGTRILLQMPTPTTLQVFLDKVESAPITSPGLVKALLDAYLGTNSVSPTLKSDVGGLMSKLGL